MPNRGGVAKLCIEECSKERGALVGRRLLLVGVTIGVMNAGEPIELELTEGEGDTDSEGSDRVTVVEVVW